MIRGTYQPDTHAYVMCQVLRTIRLMHCKKFVIPDPPDGLAPLTPVQARMLAHKVAEDRGWSLMIRTQPGRHLVVCRYR